jgi:hypothetical protein
MTDDDSRDGCVPELAPESEASESEQREAAAFAERLDRALAGERPPVDEALAAALMVRAAAHEQPLQDRGLVDRALAEAEASVAAAAPSTRGFARVRRWAPALALAASLLLLAGTFLTLLTPARKAAAPARRALPTALQSRSSDELMGRPFQDRAGASRRLDLVFADRLSGYRELRFGERSRR